MKSLIMIAAAALAVAASSASAQTYRANIPMSFHAGNAVLPAGSYEFHNINFDGQRVYTIRNLASTHSAMLSGAPGDDAPRAWREEGKPVLTFECLRDNCALSALWEARGVATVKFPGLKLKPADTERIASITVTLTKGD